MYTIVEARHIHGLCKTALQGIFCPIHTLGNRTGRIVLMTELLQMLGDLYTLLTPLLRNLVTDTPHHDARMVAVVLYQIGDILIAPLLEELGIAVLALRINPHIETLCHHHHTERIADFHLQGRRHVVGSTDGIATHLLHHLDLTDEGSLVLCCAQRTEVVVQADTLQFAGNAIELETIILGYRDSTDTGLQYLDISHLLSFISGKLYLIEIRRFRRPELWIRHLQGSLDGRSCTRDCLLGNLLASLIQQGDDGLARLAGLAFEERIYFYLSFLLISLQRAHEGIPGREVFIAIEFYGNRTVKTASRIPTAALLYIIKMYLDEVLLAKLDEWCDVDAEGIVAVSPLACLLAVDGDNRLTHGAIENEYGTLIALRSRPVHLIHALTYPRQRTRTARLLGLFSFAILLDGHHLQVPFLIKRSRDSPVVRNSYFLPRLTIAGEIPRWQVDNLSALRLAHSRECQGKSHESNASLNHIAI